MLRGPGLTPHKIRAERSSNLSFHKLRGAGLTPHFHDERSSNLSEFFPLLASFPSSIVACSTFLVAHSVFQSRFDHRHFNHVRTRSGVEGLFELVAGHHCTFSDLVVTDYD